MKRLTTIIFAVLLLTGVAYATPITLTDTTYFKSYGIIVSGDHVKLGWGYVDRHEGISDRDILWLKHANVPWKNQLAFAPFARQIPSGSHTTPYLRHDNDNLPEWAFGFVGTGEGFMGNGGLGNGPVQRYVKLPFDHDGPFDVFPNSGRDDSDFGKHGEDGKCTTIPKPAPAPVPEPATMLLLGSGLLGVGFFSRRRMK